MWLPLLIFAASRAPSASSLLEAYAASWDARCRDLAANVVEGCRSEGEPDCRAAATKLREICKEVYDLAKMLLRDERGAASDDAFAALPEQKIAVRQEAIHEGRLPTKATSLIGRMRRIVAREKFDKNARDAFLKMVKEGLRDQQTAALHDVLKEIQKALASKEAFSRTDAESHVGRIAAVADAAAKDARTAKPKWRRPVTKTAGRLEEAREVLAALAVDRLHVNAPAFEDAREPFKRLRLAFRDAALKSLDVDDRRLAELRRKADGIEAEARRKRLLAFRTYVLGVEAALLDEKRRSEVLKQLKTGEAVARRALRDYAGWNVLRQAAEKPCAEPGEPSLALARARLDGATFRAEANETFGAQALDGAADAEEAYQRLRHTPDAAKRFVDGLGARMALLFCKPADFKRKAKDLRSLAAVRPEDLRKHFAKEFKGCEQAVFEETTAPSWTGLTLLARERRAADELSDAFLSTAAAGRRAARP